jgi:hypothetical protein
MISGNDFCNGPGPLHCVQKTSFQKKVSWCRASDAELSSYRSILGENLAKVAVIPAHVSQCGVLCNTHRDEINAYHDEIVVACLNAAERAIPKCSKKGKAGWKELVDPSKKESVFWHRIWVSNGRPRSGWISDIRNSTRREYKRISRWVVHNQEQLRADKMAASLASNNTRDLWREVKDVRRSGVPAPNLVDDTQGEEEVCSLFARKYSELYSSVGYDEGQMHDLESSILNLCRGTCADQNCYCEHFIGVEEVLCAVRKLKRSKSDLLSSDHFINAPHELSVHLSLLFTAMLRHGFVPSGMLHSVLVPIPKNPKKSLSDCQLPIHCH